MMATSAAILLTLSLSSLALAQSEWITGVDIEVGASSVTLEGQYNTNDVFFSIWGRRSEFTFNETATPISDSSCTISYHGHGDNSWSTTNGISGTLLNAVAPLVLSQNSWVNNECIDWDFPDTGRGRCVKHGDVTHWQTHILSETTIYVRNIAPQGSGQPGSDQGEMSYKITCPGGAGTNCDGCKAAKLGLSVGGLVPVLGVAFGASNVLVTAACMGLGC